MKRVFRIQGEGKVKDIGLRGLAEYPAVDELTPRVAAIQALIPLGLQAVGALLQDEVTRLAGPRYARTGGQPGLVRWSAQPGSVYLLGQKLPVPVPRVRDRRRNREVPLQTYQQLRAPRGEDLGLYRKLLLGLSCRDDAACAEALPAAFGLSPSTVSRRLIRASARKLQAFRARRLEGYDLVALVLDGKTFAADAMVIALGITLQGEQVLLGFVQTATENEPVCAAFLRELVERGLRAAQGLLCVLDGAKGLRKALQTVFGAQAVVQRCQWHKRENVVRHLAKGEQALWRKKLQRAYEKPTLEEAVKEFEKLHAELGRINLSAQKSLEEGLEETLTLHRLGLFALLGRSLKTSNCVESILAQVERRCGKVSRWTDSEQKHRWLAAALLDTEPRLNRIAGYRHLPKLREALQKELGIKGEEGASQQAA